MDSNVTSLTYDDKVNQILRVISKDALDDNDKLIIDNFVNNYWQNAEIVLNATDNPNEEVKIVTSKGREVIAAASLMESPGAKMLIEKFSELVNSSTKKAGAQIDKGYARTLNNKSFPSLFPEDDEKLDVAGFTNVLIVIIGTILLGLILGAVFINK